MRVAAAAAMCTAAAACASPQPPGGEPGLSAFRSEAELVRFLKQRRTLAMRDFAVAAEAAPAPAPPGANAPSESAGVESVVVTGSRVNITNNQEVGVDEGDIVKARDDLLIILRRGRLFTVSLNGGALRPVDSINAYPPGVDASDDWYDEMVLVGDRVVVIGYSYARGGPELFHFRHLPFAELGFR
jgi:uncharacterized secreted protein with C-terminal beta-propeller domain